MYELRKANVPVTRSAHEGDHDEEHEIDMHQYAPEYNPTAAYRLKRSGEK